MMRRDISPPKPVVIGAGFRGTCRGCHANCYGGPALADGYCGSCRSVGVPVPIPGDPGGRWTYVSIAEWETRKR